jgi:hypothetical protein
MSATTVQDQAISTYQKNLTYLSKEHPDVYKKIMLLDTAINQGQYQEKYILEYKDEGYFDVKEIKSGQYLYGEDSRQLAKKAAKQVNYKKTDSVIETFYNFDFTESAAKKADEELDVCDGAYATIAPIIYYNTANIPKETSMKRIHKYIFFGVGLGLHIDTIDQKILASVYLIVERDLELFRLSLFTMDYAQLGSQSSLYFSIMEDREAFKNRFGAFYSDGFMHNHYLKYFLFDEGYLSYIKEIQSSLVTMTHLSYPHHALMRKNVRLLENLKEHPSFLKLPELKALDLTDKPILFIAAGPSLQANIAWLQKNQDRFIIVAVFMATPILKKYNVAPDLVIHVDESHTIIKRTFIEHDLKPFLKGKPFILAASIVAEQMQAFIDKEQSYFVEDRTHYKIDHGRFSGMSVGEMGYLFSLRTGAESIYLLGLDLALDQETGKTHSQGHSTDTSLELDRSDEIEQVATIRSTLLKVKGNFRDSVYTTPLFDGSIHILNQHTRNYKQPHQKVYNLNDGAFFEDTISLRADAVEIEKFSSLDKAKINTLFSSILPTISSHKLSTEERALFEIRLKDLEEKQAAIEQFASTKLVTMERFHDAFIEMSSILLKSPHANAYELTEIYSLYINYIGGYVSELTNTKELNNPKKHIKKYQKILVKQLKKFANRYGEVLEKV